MNTTRHTMQYYLEKEQAAFSRIPGMDQLIHADYEDMEALESRYPDAAFALRTANNLFGGDHEQNVIHQTAYSAILNGEPVPSVRFRFEKDIAQYVSRHMWD